MSTKIRKKRTKAKTHTIRRHFYVVATSDIVRKALTKSIYVFTNENVQKRLVRTLWTKPAVFPAWYNLCNTVACRYSSESKFPKKMLEGKKLENRTKNLQNRTKNEQNRTKNVQNRKKNVQNCIPCTITSRKKRTKAYTKCIYLYLN